MYRYDPADYVRCKEDTVRPWLGNRGYTFNANLGGSPIWKRKVSSTRHTARRDHKDGKVKKGQTYRKTTIRCVDDDTGESYHVHRKTIIGGE